MADTDFASVAAPGERAVRVAAESTRSRAERLSFGWVFGALAALSILLLMAIAAEVDPAPNK